jgi:hypothetical protein
MQLFVSWSLSVYTLNQVACFMQSLFANCSRQNGESWQRRHFTHCKGPVTRLGKYRDTCIMIQKIQCKQCYYSVSCKLHDTHFGIEHVLFCTARITIHFISDQSVCLWIKQFKFLFTLCFNTNINVWICDQFKNYAKIGKIRIFRQFKCILKYERT